METKEMSYNELVINGFMALFFNLVMLPALVFLNFLIFGQLPWLSIPVLFMLVLLFVLMLPSVERENERLFNSLYSTEAER